jgi:hypothetical protein
LFIIPLPLNAQIKKLDDKGRKPDWAKDGLAKNFIIGMASGQTQNAAKEKAMLDVKQQITEAVAVQIKSVSENLISELVHNEQSILTTTFTEITQSRTAKRDYLSGISASKISHFYWEHLINKQTDRKYYAYWVKYPFSEMELNRLVRQFKEKDRQLTKMLNQLLMTAENYTSVEELETCIAQLEKLAPIFLDERKSQAEAGIEKCKGLLKSVYISEEESQPGKVKYSLKIGSKGITTSKRPRILSNCAEIQNRDFGKRINKISYNDANCYDEPGNYIEVRYRIAHNHVIKKFPLDASAGKFAIALNGNINLVPEQGLVRLKVQSEYDTPVTITRLEMNNKVLGLDLRKKVNENIPGKGNHTITISVNPFETRKDYTSAEVNGYIYYQSSENSIRKSLRIYRQEAKITK